jgi:hypothetical protein
LQKQELRDLLEERFESVNRRILAGENRFVRVQDGKTVPVHYHLFATGFLQLVALQVRVLVKGRNPCVADFHGRPSPSG